MDSLKEDLARAVSIKLSKEIDDMIRRTAYTNETTYAEVVRRLITKQHIMRVYGD